MFFELKELYIAKSDLASAFRTLGLRVMDFNLLIMKAKSPIDGKTYYFVDKCLPFGASISCSHFQHVSNAIAHIVQVKIERKLINYLDDFLFEAAFKIWVDGQVSLYGGLRGD